MQNKQPSTTAKHLSILDYAIEMPIFRKLYSFCELNLGFYGPLTVLAPASLIKFHPLMLKNKNIYISLFLPAFWKETSRVCYKSWAK